MPQWEPLEATGFPPAPWRQVEGSPLPSVALAGAGQWLKRRSSGEDRRAADWGAGVADGRPSRDWETPQGCPKRGPPTPFPSLHKPPPAAWTADGPRVERGRGGGGVCWLFTAQRERPPDPLVFSQGLGFKSEQELKGLRVGGGS